MTVLAPVSIYPIYKGASTITPKKPSQANYFQAILNGDERIIRKIYQQFMPLIVFIVQGRNGTKDDAQDVFQDALLIIHEKVRSKSLDDSGSFKAYLTQVCRYVWMNKAKCKQQKNLPLEPYSFHNLPDSLVGIEEMLHQQAMKKLYREKFNKLSDWQQQLLKLCFEGKELKEVAQIMGFSSTAYTKKKKFLAKKRLVELIQADPRYKELVA